MILGYLLFIVSSCRGDNLRFDLNTLYQVTTRPVTIPVIYYEYSGNPCSTQKALVTVQNGPNKKTIGLTAHLWVRGQGTGQGFVCYETIPMYQGSTEDLIQ